MAFTLEIVGIQGGTPWAIKATIRGQSRYRLYHYKSEAVKGTEEWQFLSPLFFEREFYHNFDSADTLGITEVAKG